MTTENSGHDRDPAAQMDYLHDILRTNTIADEILNRARELAIPNWYLGAGCIAQTVWNFLHGFDPGFGIKD